MKLMITVPFLSGSVIWGEYGYQLVKSFLNHGQYKELVLITDRIKTPRRVHFRNVIK